MKAMLVSSGVFACESEKDLGLRNEFDGTILSHRRLYLYLPDPSDPVGTFYLPQYALSYADNPKADKSLMALIKAWGYAGRSNSVENRHSGYEVKVKLIKGEQEVIELLIFPPSAETFRRFLLSLSKYGRNYSDCFTRFRVVPMTCLCTLLGYELEFTAYRLNDNETDKRTSK